MAINTEQGRAQLDKFFTRVRLIWLAMFAGLGVYVIVTLFFIGSGGLFRETDPDFMFAFQAGIMAVALFNGVITFMIDAHMKKPERARAYLRGHKSPPGSRLGLLGEPQPDNVYAALAAYYLQLCVIRWAFAESIGVFGLVGSVAFGATVTVSALYLASAAMLVRFQPSQAELETMIRHATR